MRSSIFFVASSFVIAGCGDTSAPTHPELSPTPSPASSPDASPTATPVQPIGVFTVVTFNTGTTPGLGHDNPPDDGYTSAHATTSDQYYGNGLAWTPAVEAARDFLTTVQPDLIGFQEIFYSPLCVDIPGPEQTDFVCETWQPGDSTVVQVILSEGYQVMCHPGKDDKCVGIKKSFGSFQGCDEDFCLEGMEGYKVQDCGGGARVARAIVDLFNGETLTFLNYHGSSGIAASDMNCRVQQTEQVFIDLGAGTGPGVGPGHNVITGDLNTDPGRLTGFDSSAQRWLDFVNLPGESDKAFHFVTDVGQNATPSYSGLFNIDHVLSDSATGTCWTAGITPGHADVIDATYFDHKPVVCEVEIP